MAGGPFLFLKEQIKDIIIIIIITDIQTGELLDVVTEGFYDLGLNSHPMAVSKPPPSFAC